MKSFLALGIATLVGLGSAAGCVALVTGAAGCSADADAPDGSDGRDGSFDDANRADTGRVPADTGTGTDGGQSELAPSCASTGPDYAPILNGHGAFDCVHVGPVVAALEGMYADSAHRLAPFAYVHAGSADPAPDGTAAHPYATIDAALAGMPTARTVFLSSDPTHVAPTAAFARSIDVVGAGSRFTALRAPATGGTAAAPAYAITVQGLGTQVVLENLAIDGSAVTDPSVVGGVRVASGGSLTLRNVAIETVARGVQAQSGATVHADGVLIRSARVVGMSFAGGSTGDVRTTEIDATAGPGIFATDSHVDVTLAWVHGSTAGGGVILTGEITGTVDQLDRVSAQDNAVVGVAFARGAHGLALRVLATGSHSDASGGGFGALVTGGANVSTDPSIASDAEQGHGSRFSQNDGAGVVADGAMGTTPSELELNGAMVRHNASCGALFQNGAMGRKISYSSFTANQGAGAVVSGNSRVGVLLCNGFIANALAGLNFQGGPETLGDGLVIAYTGTQANTVLVQGSLFDQNERFGAYFVGAVVTLQGDNGLAPGAQQVAADATAMVNGYGAAPTTDMRSGSTPSGTERLAVPALAAP